MAAGLCMLALQPSVLQYCIVAPTDEAAAEPSGQEEQTVQQEESGALQKLYEAWQTRAEEDLSEVLSAASIAARDYGFALSGEGGSATATLTAVGESWFAVYPRYLVSGRLMTQQELKDGDRLIVLDEPLAFKLFPTADPIGRELTIGTERYEVIGTVRYRRSVGEYEQYQPTSPTQAPPKTACPWRSSRSAAPPCRSRARPAPLRMRRRTGRLAVPSPTRTRRPCAAASSPARWPSPSAST